MDNEWAIYHSYNRLVRRKMAQAFKCDHCKNDLQLVNGPNDEPRFRCYYCNSVVNPGLRMLSQAKSVVAEHSPDDKVRNTFQAPI